MNKINDYEVERKLLVFFKVYLGLVFISLFFLSFFLWERFSLSVNEVSLINKIIALFMYNGFGILISLGLFLFLSSCIISMVDTYNTLFVKNTKRKIYYKSISSRFFALLFPIISSIIITKVILIPTITSNIEHFFNINPINDLYIISFITSLCLIISVFIFSIFLYKNKKNLNNFKNGKVSNNGLDFISFILFFLITLVQLIIFYIQI